MVEIMIGDSVYNISERRYIQMLEDELSSAYLEIQVLSEKDYVKLLEKELTLSYVEIEALKEEIKMIAPTLVVTSREKELAKHARRNRILRSNKTFKKLWQI